MGSVIQRSFAGGEIGPQLDARCDEVKYSTGAEKLRNWYVQRYGGAATRPGTKFIAEVKDSSVQARLIPFEFSDTDTAVLEFGQQYIRIIVNDSYVMDTPIAITSIDLGVETVVNFTFNFYVDGMEIEIVALDGADQLLGRSFKVYGGTATSLKLADMNNVPIDSSAYTPYVSGGFTMTPIEIGTLYQTEDLMMLKFIQSGNVITITHNNYNASNLTRITFTNWTLIGISFSPSTASPTEALLYNPAGSTSLLWNEYCVTATDAVTFEESFPSPSLGTYSGAQAIAPNLMLWTQVSGAVMYSIYKRIGGLTPNKTSGTFGFIGTSDAKVPYGYVFNISPGSATIGATYTNSGHTYTVVATFATSTRAWMAGPFGAGTSGTLTKASGTGDATLTFSLSRQIYSFSDVGTDPNLSDPAPSDRQPFITGNGGPPACCAYIQQRLTFANQISNTELVNMSRTGRYKNFTISLPSQDDDAIQFNIAGRKVSAVKHILDIGAMVLFTQSGEFSVNSGQGGITPSSISIKQESYYGSNDMRPLVIGQRALYVQARGTAIRDLGFEFESQGYKGDDLTIFAPHLFEKFGLVDWDYQQIPDSIVWVARDDGTLLGLTYVEEQQIWAWHRHDFNNDFQNGFVERVCSIPDGDQDSIYLIVRREIGGFTKRYIEKFVPRKIIDVIDAALLDASVSYDGRVDLSISGGTDTLTLTTLTGGWTSEDRINIACTGPQIDSSIIPFDELQIFDTDGKMIRFTDLIQVDINNVSAFPNRDVPSDMRGTDLTKFARAMKTVGGLWHLEGQTVSVFADRYVVASPNNDQYEEVITVTNGIATLEKAFGVIHVGLPFVADVMSLSVDEASLVNPMTMVKRMINRVSMQLFETRGIWAGYIAPEDDPDLEGQTVTATTNLNEMQVRDRENYEEPVRLFTGKEYINTQGRYDRYGRVFIRQVDPVPATILSIIPSGNLPVGGGK